MHFYMLLHNFLLYNVQYIIPSSPDKCTADICNMFFYFEVNKKEINLVRRVS